MILNAYSEIVSKFQISTNKSGRVLSMFLLLAADDLRKMMMHKTEFDIWFCGNKSIVRLRFVYSKKAFGFQGPNEVPFKLCWLTIQFGYPECLWTRILEFSSCWTNGKSRPLWDCDKDFGVSSAK